MEESTNNGSIPLVCNVEGCFFFGKGKSAALEALMHKSRYGKCLHLSVENNLRIDELGRRGLDTAVRGASYIETIKCMEGQREAEPALTSLEP